MSTLAEVLAEHAPLRHSETGRVTWCSCRDHPGATTDRRDPPRRFDRDEHGNARKDGADEEAWAEHVVEVLAATPVMWPESCDLTMPHDMRYQPPLGCPPNCPTRVTFEGRVLDALHAAVERLNLAKRALVETGYFTADEVGDDVAPRITELVAAVKSGDFDPTRDEPGGPPSADLPPGVGALAEALDTRAAAYLAWTLGHVTHLLIEDYTFLTANPAEGWADVRDSRGDTYRLTLRRTETPPTTRPASAPPRPS